MMNWFQTFSIAIWHFAFSAASVQRLMPSIERCQHCALIDLLVHHARHEQHARAAEFAALLERELQPADGALAVRRDRDR